MKVIDLLNKIANGEDVPKKIKYEDIIYTYNEYDKDYFEIPISECEYRGLFNMKDSILTQYLNDEVEILEEEKKIPEKLSTWFSVETKQSKELNIEYANTNFENMYDKINEIIDYLKSKGE